MTTKETSSLILMGLLQMGLLQDKTASMQAEIQQAMPVWDSEEALKILQELDEERLASCLSSDAPESEIGISTITAMFEALSFHRLLDDAEVNNALESALFGLSQHHDLALADGGRYPGLYRLLAHDNQKLRLLVNPATIFLCNTTTFASPKTASWSSRRMYTTLGGLQFIPAVSIYYRNL